MISYPYNNYQLYKKELFMKKIFKFLFTIGLMTIFFNCVSPMETNTNISNSNTNISNSNTNISNSNTNISNSNTNISNSNTNMIAEQILNSLGNPTNYYVLITNNSADTTTIILGMQGGPVRFLITNYFEGMHSNFNVAYIHQVQTLEPDIYMSSNKLNSFEDSKKHGIRSAAYAFHVIRHFKNHGKKVYVVTHSFGSFVYPKVMEVFSNIADKVAITAGRLDMPDSIWQAFRDGYGGGFSNDGITPIPGAIHLTNQLNANANMLWNGARLQAGLGYTRFTQVLNNKTLSHINNTNFMYVTGWMDTAVGRLTSNEISFLQSKYVNVVELTDEGHDVDSAFNQSPHHVLTFLTNTNN